MTFGQWLAHLRAVRQLSQTDLARRTGLRQGSISQWEADARQPGRLVLLKLSSGLGVDLNTLNTPGAPIEQVIGS